MFVVVKVKLTIVDDADHYSITGDVIAPNWHHIQVKAAGVVLALCKLNTHPHTPRYYHNLRRSTAMSG